MAEQAQAKLDEAQKQFNSGQQQGQGAGPAVEYDKHGRPIASQAPPSAPPHGDPLAGTSQAPPAATPGVPPTDPGAPVDGGRAGPPPVEQPAVPPTESAPPPAPPPQRPPAGDGPPPHAAPARRREPTRPTRTATTRATRRRSSPAGIRSRAEPPVVRAACETVAHAAVRRPADRDGHAVPRATAASTRTRPSRSARHLLANGSHGLVVAGTTGEAATLTDDEQVRLVELIAGEAGRRRRDRRRRRAPTTRATRSS